ncbi:MAG: Crp/Fnr family transcriptional regulator [Anaerovoracaceae bacterium]
MKTDILSILANSRLCSGISDDEINKFLSGDFVKLVKYSKNERIFSESDIPQYFYILIYGSIAVAHDTVSGNRLMLATVDEPGDMFGEIYTFIQIPTYDMYTEALEDTLILRIDCRLFQPENHTDRQHIPERMRMNMLSVFAGKAYMMNRRLRILGCGSIREKIVRFIIQNQNGKDRIPLMPREAMADYIATTRPSLSRELGAMSKEGIIAVKKRELVILDQEALENYL